jgi:hypothetical protein
MRTKAGVAGAVAALLGGVVAGSASAALGAETGHFSFYDCAGPAGTPASFTATKENLPGSAVHGASAALSYLLTDGSAVFVVQQFGNTTIAPGIPQRNLTVTCQVDLPSGSFALTGFLVPRGT